MAETSALAESFALEMDLVHSMESANLPLELNQDVRDLCRLIQEKAEYPEFPNLRLDLMRSLNHLVQAATNRRPAG